jgi:hypothetical protein|tara:strand:+ start:660 stop:1094 length:435 start_codon:yes stop_codon:yes gene_type:complete
MAVSDWALPAALVGGWLILREMRGGIGDLLPTLGNLQIRGTAAALEERTEALQDYEQERTLDAIAIEAQRAQTELAKPQTSYGTVPGSLGAFTGTWSREPGKPGNSCSVLYATGRASGTTRYFTGGYCRTAETMGLIDPFTGGA